MAPADYERMREELKARLEALGDEEGAPIGTIAHRPEDLYPDGARNVVPDLMVYFGDLSWRSLGGVGEDGVHSIENDSGPDDANHAHAGLYVMAGPQVDHQPAHERGIRDIAPTILTLMGLPIPSAMEGRSIV